MGKMFFYLFGMLAIAYTDFEHSVAFYSLVLPVFDLLFIIFLGSELLFYFTVLGFSKNEYNAFDLCRDLVELRADVAQFGAFDAITTLLVSLADLILLFVAIVFVLGQIFDLAIV